MAVPEDPMDELLYNFEGYDPADPYNREELYVLLE